MTQGRYGRIRGRGLSRAESVQRISSSQFPPSPSTSYLPTPTPERANNSPPKPTRRWPPRRGLTDASVTVSTDISVSNAHLVSPPPLVLSESPSPVGISESPKIPRTLLMDTHAGPSSPSPSRNSPAPSEVAIKDTPKMEAEVIPETRPDAHSQFEYTLPEQCKKSHPDYEEERRLFFSKQRDILMEFGLEVTSEVYMEDAIIIDCVPIQPDRSASDALKMMLEMKQTPLPLLKRKRSVTPKLIPAQALPTPPGTLVASATSALATPSSAPSSKKRLKPIPLPPPKLRSPSPASPAVKPTPDIDSNTLTVPEIQKFGETSFSLGDAFESGTVIRGFIKWFVNAFGADPSILSCMYAEDAIFSFRFNRKGDDAMAENTGDTLIRSAKGRFEIVDAMSAIKGLRFCRRTQLVYDVSRFSEGELLTLHGEIEEGGSEGGNNSGQVLRSTQVFLLGVVEADGDMGEFEVANHQLSLGLTCISHQIVVVEVPSSTSLMDVGCSDGWMFSRS